ncbi:hypothetical protein ACHQM5_011718 [Ranunculus cassubicifolius]
MENEEIEAVLEKIWDIHDKLSDAIHSISRSQFLNTIKTLKNSQEIYYSSKRKEGQNGDENNGGGFVFMKDVRMDMEDDDDDGIAEAKSLNAIRNALENLEDQLEFFHTVQLQQRAERDTAIARLEQSRIVLAMRLADHQGKHYKVIDEALAFVGDVRNSSHFISPEQLFGSPRSQSGENSNTVKIPSFLMRVLASSYTLAKRSLQLDQIGGVLGQAALVAVSMVALLHLHQISGKGNFAMEIPQRSVKRSSKGETSGHLDVFAARG